MNIPILSAAILSIFTLFVHVFLGGPDVHLPALSSSMSAEWKAVFSVVWHAISAILLINGLALLSALNPAFRMPIVSIVAVQYFAFAVLFIFYGLVRLGTVWPMPQWIVFAAIAGLALWGLRPSGAPAG